MKRDSGEEAFRKSLATAPEPALDRMCRHKGIDSSHPLMTREQKIQSLVMAHNASRRFAEEKGKSRKGSR